VATQPKKTRGDKTKSRANKKVLLSTAAAIAVVVATPVAYTKWWVPQQDQRIYAQVQEDVSGLIENSYTGAIYESVTSDQLKDISKDIRRIHSDSLRAEVESDTKSILDQVQVQTRAKETLAKVQAAKTYAEIKPDDVKQLIQDAGAIKNVTLRAKVLKEANLILERYTFASGVIAEVGALKEGDWADYYTAEANVSLVSYGEVRDDLNAKLKKIKVANEKADKATAQANKDELNQQVKEAEVVTYDNSVTRGKSTITEQTTASTTTTSSSTSTADGIARDYLSANQSTNVLILLSGGQLSLYKRTTTSTGYSKVTSESNSASDLDVSETTSVELGYASAPGSSDSNEVVKISDLVLGTEDYADLQVSSSFFSELKTLLNQNTTGVTFIAK
jgi:hypothetical protein